ncbi:MAG: MBOAT family protein [Lysobacterales bacterium]|jgi:D-alanyl-lipoteichoic acid acyltransferase DltB (MBOAT superfamily)
MLFNSFHFVAFFGVVLALNHLLKGREEWRRWVLLLASAYFYGQWNWLYLVLIYTTVVVDFFAGRRIYMRLQPRMALLASLCVNLGILGFFKYGNFFGTNLVEALARAGIDVSWSGFDVLLPVGISFYTFQSMSYTIDMYRGQLQPRQKLRDYALFVSFFPQLVAGPIVRASEFFRELDKKLHVSKRSMQTGLSLVIIGLVKKVVLADNLAPIVDAAFSDPVAVSGWQLLIAVYAFAFQIYFDFSGYTDIAIGAARTLGFRFPKNFNHPYSALSIRDFWRRWHMTLSRWLRDYLYISLGGNRKGRARTLANLAVTMLLGGLWHGASWNFVIWGGLHGLYLALERVLRRWFRFRLPAAVHWLITFHLVCFAWIFFRAEDFATSRLIASKIFRLASEPLLAGVELYQVALLALLLAAHWVGNRYRLREKLYTARPVAWGALSACLLLSLLVWAPTESAPFIYFQF